MRSGYTLVELVVALVLLSVMGLGLLRLVHEGSREARRADLEERMLWAASATVDSLASDALTGPGERLVPGVARLRWSGGTSDTVEVRRWPTDSLWIGLAVADHDVAPAVAAFRPEEP